MKITRSRYAKKNVVVSDLRQEDALAYHLDRESHEEHTIMDKVQEEMDSNPDKEVIRCENPCHYGMTLCAIQKGNLVLHCVNYSCNYNYNKVM